MSTGPMATTSARCLDGQHLRCLRCACTCHHHATPTPKPKATPQQKTPRAPRTPRPRPVAATKTAPKRRREGPSVSDPATLDRAHQLRADGATWRAAAAALHVDHSLLRRAYLASGRTDPAPPPGERPRAPHRKREEATVRRLHTHLADGHPSEQVRHAAAIVVAWLEGRDGEAGWVAYAIVAYALGVLLILALVLPSITVR